MIPRLRASATVIALMSLLGALLSVGTITEAGATPDGSGGEYIPVTPTRIADTGTGAGTPQAPIGSNSSRTFQILGKAGIPTTDIGAIVLDVAVYNSTANTTISVGPSGSPKPAVGTLAAQANDPDVSNTAVVRPGTDGKITVWNSAGSTDLNVDVQGYFTENSTSESSGGFVPITPTRLVASSNGTGLSAAGKFTGGTTYTSQIAGRANIPSDAIAVFANVRVSASTGYGGLRVGASNSSIGSAPASVNYQTNRYNDTGMAIKLGPDGQIKMAGSSGTSFHVSVDVQGYFTAGTEGATFFPLNGASIYDSRNSSILPAGQSRTVKVTGLGGVPDDQTAGLVALTVRAVNYTHSGSVSVFNPDEPEGANGTSNVGFFYTDSVTASSTSIVPLSSGGEVAIQNNSTGPVNVILGAQGYFSRLPQQFGATFEDGSTITYDVDSDSTTIDAPPGVPILSSAAAKANGDGNFALASPDVPAEQNAPNDSNFDIAPDDTPQTFEDDDVLPNVDGDEGDPLAAAPSIESQTSMPSRLSQTCPRATNSMEATASMLNITSRALGICGRRSATTGSEAPQVSRRILLS